MKSRLLTLLNQRWGRACIALYFGSIAAPSFGQTVTPPKVTLPAVTGTGWTKATAKVQEFLDFFQGPVVVAAAVISVALGIIMYMFMPKEGAINTVFKIIFGLIIILNIVIWLNAFIL